MSAALDISGLSLAAGALPLVHDVTFSVGPGEVMGLVGESGSGKSLTIMTAAGLLPRGIHQTNGRIKLGGQSIDDVNRHDIGIVFQDPFTSLNPVKKISDLLLRVLKDSQGLVGDRARQKVIKALSDVGIPEPETKIDAYPHQLSGGQRQRVVIALALLNAPKLLIADEPTSALDPSVQKEILDLIRAVKRDAATLFVTHDMGAAAYLCDQLAVMYAGRIVEIGLVSDVLLRPRHPYSAALIACTPQLDGTTLVTVNGTPTSAAQRPKGCAFRPRCAYATQACIEQPALQSRDGREQMVACHHPLIDQAGEQ